MAANAESYKPRRFATRSRPLRDGLPQIPKEPSRWLVTCEGGLLAISPRDFGMKELYLWPMKRRFRRTPQQVRKVIDSVRNNDIPSSFAKARVNTSPAKQVCARKPACVPMAGVLYVDRPSTSQGPCQPNLDLLRVTSQGTVQGTGLDAGRKVNGNRYEPRHHLPPPRYQGLSPILPWHQANGCHGDYRNVIRALLSQFEIPTRHDHGVW